VVKWLATIYTLVISVIIACIILTVTGVIHPQELVLDCMASIPAFAPYVEAYNIGKEQESWRQQQQAELDLQIQQLVLQREELESLRQQLLTWDRQLTEKENDLLRQEEALKAQQAKAKSIADLAQLYMQMRPEEAAAILKLMDNNMVLDIILAMDKETAALILVALPPTMAAELSSQFQ